MINIRLTEIEVSANKGTKCTIYLRGITMLFIVYRAQGGREQAVRLC